MKTFLLISLVITYILTASGASYSVANYKSGNENGHEWVDLGLSVKWATCNMGATTPSEYGLHYAWGEIENKKEFSWKSYFDCKDNQGKEFEQYNREGGMRNISPTSGQDVAREKWGGNWRLPTWTECLELRRKCKWVWGSNNGTKGYYVTGPNGNKIFLPASGQSYGTNKSSYGTAGFYWSNTLSFSYSEDAIVLGFGADGNNPVSDVSDSSRFYGFSVRPVID